MRMLQKAGLRVFFGLVLCVFFNAGHAQVFDRLYPDSLSIALAQPLEWVAVPKDSVASPDAFTTAETAAGPKHHFQPYTDDTVLPTNKQQEAWARFALPMTDKLQNWYIRLPGQAVYKVSLYARDAQGNWQVQSAGEAIAPANWALRTRVPSFELQSHSESAQSYYLRFENRRPITERPMLLTPIEYIDGASRVGVVIGLMWGIFALLTGLCLGAYAMARNKVFLWFGAVVVTLMFTQLVLIGYGGWRIWPYSTHLNQVMGWVSSTVTMAVAAWFCTQASYTRDGHPRIHRLLAVVAAVNLLLACVMAVHLDLVPRELRNLWLAISTVAILGSLIWISLRGQAWNLMLLLGAGPICLAALARLSYNMGWMFNVESAQAAGVISAMAGLLWVFLVLAWRSRAALFSNHRGAALSTYDPASGLMLPRIVAARLPQMLLRARKQKSACGVLMIHWLNQAPSHDEASDQKRGAALSRLGEILRGAARDVDTVARHDENHFMMLIEGPINRAALSEAATKILADCIRACEKLGEPGAFSLHIAIWHDTPGTQAADEVMDLLAVRLHHMASGTKRPVQFVDSPLEPGNPATGGGSRREDLLAKINAIETSHPSLAGERSAE
ncbi:GGDEF domain-containing protein, diguanylate cyclase (c-di-GMP synthetase) or its enzymatically inactive variants [Polaromonas sp. YR568]|uniref:sensor domain-containing diguanylate cyclase n=1 Tax=Polaromonas sp. YR568 TaxID=1855301 RepID=UPI0008ED277D|nr:7TM diverse intracellular signaling domain-containing protein [Polaromonas sp. YR568]SFU59731.1 GGDEF domain-containing protein, diguanylate cyclase (c-di-GMP synthetase) or its enzymatically inactive variants [Polaromonas sp. YR568]